MSPGHVYLEDNVSQGYHAQNTGTGVLDEVRVDTDISVDQKPTSIYARAWREPGELWIAVNGGALHRIANVAALDAVTVNPYAATLPDGSAGLGDGDRVTDVRFVTGGFQPADGADVLVITSKVLPTTSEGNEAQAGDVYSVDGAFTVHDSVGEDAYVRNADHSYTIVARPAPRTVLTVGAGNQSGGTTANGGTANLSWSVGVADGDDAPNPVMVARLGQAAERQLLEHDQQRQRAAPADDDGRPARHRHRPDAGPLHVAAGHGGPQAKLGRHQAQRHLRVHGVRQRAVQGLRLLGHQDLRLRGRLVRQGQDSADYDDNGVTSQYLCAWGDQVVPTPSVGGAAGAEHQGCLGQRLRGRPGHVILLPGILRRAACRASEQWQRAAAQRDGGDQAATAR